MTRSDKPSTPMKFNAIDKFTRGILLRRISSISRGELLVQDPLGGERFASERTTNHPSSDQELSVLVKIHKPRFYRHAVFGGTLSLAESYLNGDWDCDELTDLFRLLIRNLSTLNSLNGALAGVTRMVHRIYHAWHANTRRGSRKNIAAHYDLGNDFYDLWLDETLAYSCGIFPSADASMAEASQEKFDLVCRKLAIEPSDHVIEIGTGWGGFALHAAEKYSCEVTSTTISQAQFDRARQRVIASGLTNQIHLLQQDYRDLRGQFDKLVSIEMIEAVGHRFLDSYFRKCSELLRSEGSMVIQAIVMPDQRYREYLKSVDFIQRYVFPGGSLPSVGAILDSVGRTTDLRLVHVEDFAPHYAETLRRWRKAFWDRIEDVRGQGYSERFIRLWHYYLCYCEAVFEERHIGLVQIQFDKPLCRGDALKTVVDSHIKSQNRHLPTHSHKEPQRCSR